MRIPRRRITPPPFIWKWPPSIGVKSHLFIELIHSFNFFSAPINHKCPFIRTVIQGLSEIHIPDLKRRLTWKTAAQKHACFRLSDNPLMPLCEYLFIRKKTLLGIQHFVFCEGCESTFRHEPPHVERRTCKSENVHQNGCRSFLRRV